MGTEGAVLLVANYPSDVGYAWWLMEQFWSIIAREAKGANRKCVLAYPQLRTVPQCIRDAPIEVHERPIARNSVISVVCSFRFIRKYRVRSIYLTDWPLLSWAYLFWRVMGVRCIIVHDHTPGDRPPSRGAKGVVKAFAHALRLFSADRYVAVSEYIRQRHVENGRIPPNKTVAVENGIEPFDCSLASARVETRKSIDVPGNAIVVALVSRATYYKGLDFAIECLSHFAASEREYAVHFVHCGDGPDLTEFLTLAERRGVADRMHFLGRRNDVRQILCASDIAFHPSRGEGMSLAVLEFMCAGLPVVVPDRPSVCCSVQHNETGIVYRAENVASAVSALERLVGSASDRKRMGEAGATLLRSKYTLDETKKLLLHLVARPLVLA